MPEAGERDLRLAIQHHQAGRLEEAERIYRQVLTQQPDHASALHLLGVLAAQTGRPDAAVEFMRRAIANCSTNALYYSNLGSALTDLGQLDEAIAACRQAIQLKPGLAEVHHNLGNALKAKAQFGQAIDSYRQAIRLKPGYAEAHSNLGIALAEVGQPDEAIASFRQAIQLKPELAEAHYNMSIVLQGKGQLDQAIAAFRQAIRLKPDNASAHCNLGNALKDKRQLDEAIAAYRQAIRLKPGFAEAHNNLGNALKDKGQLDEAIASYRQAIRLKPDLAEAHNNLGNTLKDKGQLDEAIASYRQAIRLQPGYAEAQNNLGALADTGQLDEAIASQQQALWLRPDYVRQHSNLIFTLHYHPDYDGRMIQEELRRWNQQHAEPLKKLIQSHANDRDLDRRLRIGYVSADFRGHVVGQNLWPLLRQHDHRQMEIFCYSDVLLPDAQTEVLRRYADVWRSIVGMSDGQAADLIRQDRIDILVDLSLHSANNRLLVFAQKPAPVQVSYLGYCGSTGMHTMDYRLSDPFMDPSDSDLSLYSEQTIRLPETYWCYGVAGPTPDPAPPPAATVGYVTFGCLNKFVKVSPPALDLWAEILRGVPQSRLIVHSHPGAHLDAVRERFAGKGISPDRLEFPGWQPWAQYARTYGRIDIALDPFPWGGGITTCDALWLGVPVVSLVGRTAVGRGGASILANVGVPELIAPAPEQYVQIATELAKDLPRLAELRRTLRGRMLASPLMDGPRFARNVEAAYRQMWRNWCQHGGNSSLQCPAP
ncbi:MAG: tetratricopeptide repeat protein [Tepidisphaeraceae bacterium]|jgi:predicted O-linked N-acetylglucosamine transferase (SPINDLY family)